MDERRNGNATDKRVDRAMKRLGYHNADIYYSPVYIPMSLSLAMWSMLYLPVIFSVGLQHPVVFIVLAVHIMVEYLLAAPFNNCIVVHGNELIIINTNPPYRHITKYNFDQIENVELNTTKKEHWFNFLSSCFWTKNYIQVNTATGSKRYYCMALDIDYDYEIGNTQKTIDDLVNVLRYKTRVNFDYTNW